MENRKKIEDNKNISSDARNRIIQAVDHAAGMANLNPGDPVPLIIGGELHHGVHSGKQAQRQSANQYHDCTLKTCQENQQAINQLCKQQGWPPNRPILICNTQGECCFCYCR